MNPIVDSFPEDRNVKYIQISIINNGPESRLNTNRNPTDPFTNLELHEVTIQFHAVRERRSTEFETPKLRKVEKFFLTRRIEILIFSTKSSYKLKTCTYIVHLPEKR